MNPSAQQSSFVFLRHGLTDANRDRIIQGQSDYELSKEGIEQVDALIKSWIAEDRNFNLIVSSPLIRARATAERIAHQMNIEMTTDEIWMERHHGDAQGAQYTEVMDWYADRPPPSPFEPVFGSGETEWDLHIRACRAIDKIINFDPGQYLIVSHGGFLGAVLRSICGIAPSSGRIRPIRFSFANTGYAELRFNHDEARWNIDSLNTTAHLRSF